MRCDKYCFMRNYKNFHFECVVPVYLYTEKISMHSVLVSFFSYGLSDSNTLAVLPHHESVHFLVYKIISSLINKVQNYLKD